MRTSTLTINFTTAQRRDAALRAAGISPQERSLKPGTRVNRTRKADAQRCALTKHRKNSRVWD
jgi:hypothetical protein